MKENTFSEKDSLELISQMLKQTKDNLGVGSGNIFLYYGYSAFFISLIVFGFVYFTANNVWGCFVVPDVCPKCDYLCKEQKRQATRGDLYG